MNEAEVTIGKVAVFEGAGLENALGEIAVGKGTTDEFDICDRFVLQRERFEGMGFVEGLGEGHHY